MIFSFDVLQKLIDAAASQHRLSAHLIRAIVKTESGGDPAAMRYEPGFFDRYVDGRGFATYLPCSRDTEERLRAFSFGLMQIMGQTARELGFRGVFLTELLDPAVNLEWGCRLLSKLMSRYRGDVEKAVSAYNAGSARCDANGKFSNQGYVDKIRAAGGFGGVV